MTDVDTDALPDAAERPGDAGDRLDRHPLDVTDPVSTAAALRRIAQWDGSRLTRYLPGGTVERRIRLPVRRPTSLAFRDSLVAVTGARPENRGSPHSPSGTANRSPVSTTVPVRRARSMPPASGRGWGC